MAPIPKDTRDNPQEGKDTDSGGLEPFHNPNLMFAAGDSDSSDEEQDGDMVAPGGYSLLPSEPGNYQEDSDSDCELEEESSSNQNLQGDSGTVEGATAQSVEDRVEGSAVPDTVLASKAGSSTPTVQASAEDESNPAAREKYPYGKIPSYLHVPSLPRDKDGLLWNERRSGPKKQALDKGQESAILKAMSGFQLPPESIPAWAKSIPEDEWRQQIHSHVVRHSDETTSKAHYPSSSGEKSGLPEQTWVAEFPDDV